MDTKHTPGPWEVTTAGRDFKGDATYTLEGVKNVQAADARLIAAAPDLLSLAKQWVALDGGAWHVQRHANEKAELMADTRAAIAKATGA